MKPLRLVAVAVLLFVWCCGGAPTAPTPLTAQGTRAPLDTPPGPGIFTTLDAESMKVGAVGINREGIHIIAGDKAANAIVWTDGSSIAGNGGFIQIGADLYVAGSARFAEFGGKGNTRYVCHDNNGHLYSSAGACAGPSTDLAAAHARIATLEARLAALEQQVSGGVK